MKIDHERTFQRTLTQFIFGINVRKNYASHRSLWIVPSYPIMWTDKASDAGAAWSAAAAAWCYQWHESPVATCRLRECIDAEGDYIQHVNANAFLCGRFDKSA